jgi:tetratricopeptide (TPR) repeat protein
MTALMHKSGLAYEMGKVAEAADGYSAAVKLLENLKRPNYLAAGYQGLALAQIRLKQFDEAESNLRRAQKILKKHGSPSDTANLRFTQGFLEAWRGNYTFAHEYLDEALLLCNDIPSMASRDVLRARILEIQQQITDGTLQDVYRLA